MTARLTFSSLLLASLTSDWSTVFNYWCLFIFGNLFTSIFRFPAHERTTATGLSVKDFRALAAISWKANKYVIFTFSHQLSLLIFYGQLTVAIGHN